MGLLNILREVRGTSGKEAMVRLERDFIMDRTNIAPDKLDVITQDLIRTLRRHAGIEEKDIRVIIRMKNSTNGVGTVPVIEIIAPLLPRQVDS